MISPVPAHVARRSLTGGYRLWEDELDSKGTARAAWSTSSMTQREWTESKEAAARERAKAREHERSMQRIRE